MKIPNKTANGTPVELSLARIVSEDSQPHPAREPKRAKSSKDS